MLRSILIMVGGLLLVWIGLRSVSGPETTAEHLYAGQFEEIVCRDGEAVSGKGVHLMSAHYVCQQEQEEDRSRAPWWIAGGVLVFGAGILQFRKVRAG